MVSTKEIIEKAFLEDNVFGVSSEGEKDRIYFYEKDEDANKQWVAAEDCVLNTIIQKKIEKLQGLNVKTLLDAQVIYCKIEVLIELLED